MKYDCIIVGSGFCGSVIARELANKGKKVLVWEKRPHIAGNMYDEVNEDGILVQRYGPHTFITDDKKIVEYLSSYDDFHPYYVNAKVMIDDQVMPMPFNFESIQMFYGKEKAAVLISKMKTAFPGMSRVPVFQLTEHQDEMIRAYGDLLCEKDYIPYTAKQWGIPPEEVDRSVIARVQVALSYDTQYMQQKYQMMPDISFSHLFENILSHENIKVVVSLDALEHIRLDYETGKVHYTDFDEEIPLVFTGPIDELFNQRYGKLPYRSLDIQFNTYDKEQHQDVAFVAYPQAEGYTRVSEYKNITGQTGAKKTTLSTEYPLEYRADAPVGNIPYYPIISKSNLDILKKYKSLEKKFPQVITCGRLGDYKYYNMDAAISRALDVVEMVQKIYSQKYVRL